MSGFGVTIWNRLARLRRDERGSVTLQVIFFSLMLFGTTALVLDSGSVYTKHSQMQAFTDQMALAAASELDGQDDAIQRATNAVFGTASTDPYLSQVAFDANRYEVEHIAFFSTMEASDKPQNDMSEAFTAANLVATSEAGPHIRSEPTITYFGGNSAQSSNAALYAVVKARNTADPSIASQFVEAFTFQGSISANGNQAVNYAADDSYRRLQISSVSAASLKSISCADLSTLVFCNPWEDQSPNQLEVDPSDASYSVPGRSLLYFAPNFQGTPAPVVNGQTEHGSIYNWDVNHQLFKLTGPLADASAICSDANVPRLTQGEDYATARDRCMMARAQVDTVCWSEDEALTIAPAHGPDVQRAINTIFDIWMEPFATTIANTSVQPGTGMTVNQLFEPDMVAASVYETADRHGDDGDGDPATWDPAFAQDGTPDYTDGNSTMINYLGHTGPEFGFTILDNVYFVGAGYDVCHANTYSDAVTGTPNGGACAVDFVGDHFEGNSGTTSGAQTRMGEYWERQYDVTGTYTANPAFQNPSFCGTSLEGSIPGLSDFCEVATVPATVDTWYKLYQRERSLANDIATDGTNSRVNVWNAQNMAKYGLSDPQDDYVKQFPDDYYAASGTSNLFLAGRERRRMRSAMVNCGASVAGGTTQNGDYEVDLDDVHIVDMYLSLPASHFCGPNIASCDVDASVETQMFVEMIQDVTEDLTLQRYTAHLVR